MFNELTGKLEIVFRKLSGRATISEKNISDALQDIRQALLEADVHYKVVQSFIDKATQKALGQDVLKSVSPAQQMVKIVYDELVQTLGSESRPIVFSGLPPHAVMIAGLQGSGKTTFTGKLANYLLKKGKRPLLVAADVYRPAAADQLKILGQSLNLETYTPELAGNANPVEICIQALEFARKNNFDVALFDTAGRLHIDQELMDELKSIREKTKPAEILFVADGMTGQDAVNTAKIFAEQIDFDGIVLTKLDGDARGGAALSIREVSGKPIKFISTGEKIDALEEFHPDRMASRILGMGDIVSLVEKAQETIDLEKAKELEAKFLRNEFTLEDLADQIKQMKRMGSLESILGMIPGIGSKIRGLNINDKTLTHMTAIISSMTPAERKKPHSIDGRRRLRIARGSGTSVQEVNQLLKQYTDMQKMMKKLGKINPAEVMKMMQMKGLG